MTAISAITIERGIAPGRAPPEVMPGGIALSATLHIAVLAAILIGLPNLFRPPPPKETPIAVNW